MTSHPWGSPFTGESDLGQMAADRQPTVPFNPDWRADTITSFPAIRDDAPAQGDEPCRCGMCPSAPAEPGKDAILSCGPGVVSRMWRTRVLNGQWDDLPALWDKAHAAVHLPALNAQRHIRDDLAARRHDIAAMLSRSPSLLADRVLRDGLEDMESRLAGRLADMQAEAAAKGEAA